MTAVGLPLALVLGFLADAAAGLVRGGPRGAAAVAVGAWDRTRRIGATARRPSLLGTAAAAAALYAAGLAAASAVGAASGSLAFLYLALVAAAVAGHAAALQPEWPRRGPEPAVPFPGAPPEAPPDPVGRARVRAALVEPAFAVALAAGFLRWRAADVGAVLGAQEVVGNAFQVGPPPLSAALALALAALLAAGAARMASPAVPGTGPAPALLVGACRWALAGATALVAAALVAGQDLGDASLDLGLLVWLGVAVAAAGVLGAVAGAVDRLGHGVLGTLVVAGGSAALAAGAATLVVLG